MEKATALYISDERTNYIVFSYIIQQMPPADKNKNYADRRNLPQNKTAPEIILTTPAAETPASANPQKEGTEEEKRNNFLILETNGIPSESEEITKTIEAAGSPASGAASKETEVIKEVTIEDTIVGEKNIPSPIPVSLGQAEKTPDKTAPAEKPKHEETPSKIKSIRTYKSDVAERIKSGKTSIVGIAVAEEERRLAENFAVSPKSAKNILFIYSSVLLVLLGIGITITVVLNRKSGETSAGKTSGAPSLLFAEKEKVITATDTTPGSLVKMISDEVSDGSNKLDTLESIYVTETINGAPAVVTAQRFFFFLDQRMPPSLLRSLGSNFALGIHTFNGNHLFIVLKTNYYENAFAGMLGWEEHMARDLFPIFGIKKKEEDGIFLKPFEDKTIKNLDARVLRDESGEIVLFYAFKDRGTIIITDSENTLEEVVRRLNYSTSSATR